MAEFDLTAERAKRNPESKSLILRDSEGAIIDKYELAPEFPADALDAGAKGELLQALRGLFLDPEEAEAFVTKYKPSVDDLLTIMRGVYGLGANQGESSASGK